MYYEKFEELCKRDNVTASKVSRETGISTATLSSWKTGRYTPKNEKLQIIADYFKVPLSFIIGDTDVQNIGQHGEYYLNEDARELAQFLMENPAYKELFDASRKVKASDIAIVKQLLDRFGGDDES